MERIAPSMRLWAAIILTCYVGREVRAEFVYSDGNHASSQAVVGGFADPNSGRFASYSEVNNFEFETVSLETANAAAGGATNVLGRFQLKAAATSTRRGGVENSGITRAVSSATAECTWADRVFVTTGDDVAPTISIGYSLHGVLTAFRIGPERISAADLGGVVTVSTPRDGLLENHGVGINVYGYDDGDLVSVPHSYNGSFNLPLISTGKKGEYYADVVFGVKVLVNQSSETQLAWDISSDFSNTFYLTGATANGQSLQEAGVTLEFQSELERAAVPEPHTFAIIAFGFAAGGLLVRRR